MHITIDTNNMKELDWQVIALLGNHQSTQAFRASAGQTDEQLTDKIQAGRDADRATEQEAPKRARRTKLEIAFDDALGRFNGPHTDEGYELAGLAEAFKALHGKDPQNERLKSVSAELMEKLFPSDEPTPASEDAEGDTTELKEESERADEPAAEASQLSGGDSISMEELKELATKLISSDRPAMVELLKQFGARRLSDIPEQDWGKFASEIRTKLA